MIETFKYFCGINAQGGLCAVRGYGVRMGEDGFRSEMRKYFFTEGMVNPWNGLPVEVVEMRTVSEFKEAWDKHRGSLKEKKGTVVVVDMKEQTR